MKEKQRLQKEGGADGAAPSEAGDSSSSDEGEGGDDLFGGEENSMDIG